VADYHSTASATKVPDTAAPWWWFILESEFTFVCLLCKERIDMPLGDWQLW
jgi:hypothetical protein